MDKPTHPQPDPELVAALAADIGQADRDPAVVQAAAAAVARAVADIDRVYVAEAADKSDDSLRIDIWETATVQFEDLLPEEHQEAWERESGTSWQIGTSGAGQMQDVLAAAVNAAVKRLG